MIDQVMIGLTGAVAVLLTQQQNPRLKRYACWFGIAGQPFWFFATYKAQQWGIFALSFLYAYAWFLGLYNNWIKPAAIKGAI
tara:strand:- start:5920 stop:6165 length:246 start_codon:yes stop_codon:yes gene_type:complete